MAVTALGMIETVGLVSAIEAADAGLKAAEVRLLGTDYVRGGLVMVRFEGDVAAVQAAVDAGAAAAQRVGRVFSAHVIPRAMPEVFCMLASDVNEGPAKLHSGGCAQCGGCEGGRRECQALRRAEAAKAKNAGSAGTERQKEHAMGSEREHGQEHQKEHGQAANRKSQAEHATEHRLQPASASPAGSTPAGQAHTLKPSDMQLEQLNGMKVVQLRQLARKLKDFPMTANEIRYSGKQQLLTALRAWKTREE